MDLSEKQRILWALDSLLAGDLVACLLKDNPKKRVNASWLSDQLEEAYCLRESPKKINAVLDTVGIRRYSSTKEMYLIDLQELAINEAIDEYAKKLYKETEFREMLNSNPPIPIQVNLDPLEPAGAVGGDN